MNGFFAAFTISPSAFMSASDGAVSAGSTRGASATSAISVSMSSGSEITTGPGLPCIATRNARATSSGMRSALSISTTHLAIEPNTAL